jgi:hypothetical protein
MPFEVHTKKSSEDRRTRVLQCGPPNSRKTSTFLTWPKPIIFINVPGEKGQDTIPADTEGILSFNFVLPADGKLPSAQKAIDELDTLITHVLAGKHGQPATVIVEGLHKLNELYMDAVTDGAFNNGEEFDPRFYGRGKTMLLEFITRLSLSKVPHVGFSVWDDYEKDRQKKGTEDAKSYGSTVNEHIYPALFGKLAKRIMGEFSVVCFNKQARNAKGETEWVWQIQPGGEVWGAGVKLPPERAAKLPANIPMGFQSLHGILFPNP